jgi:hypothetical protein
MNYDLFISHASEDKDFVRPLSQELRSQGYIVWYDEFELKLGDSLSEKIDHGLASSKFGIVVLSNHFFNKKWTKRELRGLVARETQEDKTILPIWHNISKEEIIAFSPPLADLVAARSEDGLLNVVTRIKQVAQPTNSVHGMICTIEEANEALSTMHFTTAMLIAAKALQHRVAEYVRRDMYNRVKDKWGHDPQAIETTVTSPFRYETAFQDLVARKQFIISTDDFQPDLIAILKTHEQLMKGFAIHDWLTDLYIREDCLEFIQTVSKLLQLNPTVTEW